MKKKILSVISAVAAVTAILPGMNLSTLNTKPEMTASASPIYNVSEADYGWRNLMGKLYYFDKSGIMITDAWIAFDNAWYYFNPDGTMAANQWVTDNGDKYYLGDDGKMVTNQFVDYYGTEYFINNVGCAVKNDWAYVPSMNTWCYFNVNGKIAISPDKFANPNGTVTTVGNHTITQTKTVGDKNFKLIIDLKTWKQNAYISQFETLADLFWNCYPAMYSRFASDIPDQDVDVKLLLIQSNDYAYTDGHTVYINEGALVDHREDYDFFTHELAHSLQNRLKVGKQYYWTWAKWEGWNGNYLEDDEYIENFANYCRYVYAYKDGLYNDGSGWEPRKMQPNGEATHNSFRFLLWLDYMDRNNDITLKFFNACISKSYPKNDWSRAWEDIFKGTVFNGRTIDNVWQEYLTSSFSNADAVRREGQEKSDLITQTNVRNVIKNK
ncbi:MAG: hypothetical protein K6G33_04490 [Ruminococcus sp.]|uniref:hypothetical protein n=1 Tax=Ruminococcus sp. TaxID=41978 RepID=UPI0025DE55F6|nr:hypothetical protein [Ruminococcus sp.]MCR5599983.1 hypothetical protein [Ruminococcus sp.]